MGGFLEWGAPKSSKHEIMLAYGFGEPPFKKPPIDFGDGSQPIMTILWSAVHLMGKIIFFLYSLPTHPVTWISV